MSNLRIRRALAIIGFVLLLVICEHIATYFVLPVNNYRVGAIRERQELEGGIDTVLLGASLTSDGVNPRYLQERLGAPVFNMATSTQSLRLSYHALLDVLEKNNLRSALIEVSFNRLSRRVDQRGARIYNLAFTDSLFSQESKWRYIREHYSLDDLPGIFLMSARCQLSFVAKNLPSRFSPDYLKDYLKNGYVEGTGENAIRYVGLGHVAYAKRVRRGGMGTESARVGDINDVLGEAGVQNMEEVRRIVALCRERGITPILFSVPMPDARMMQHQAYYQTVTDIIQGLADELDVDYYDFNYAKRMRSELDDTCFRDDIHLNRYGAEVLSPYMAEVIVNGAAPGEFYQTFDEMISSIERVGGVSVELEEGEGAPLARAVSLHWQGLKPEYRFFIRPQGSKRKKETMIRDYAAGEALPLEGIAQGRYTLRVEARDSAHPEREFDAFAELDVELKG